MPEASFRHKFWKYIIISAFFVFLSHFFTTQTVLAQTATVKTLVFNVGTDRDLPEDAKTPDRAAVCHPAMLSKAIHSSQFFASYMAENKIEIGMFQEISHVCGGVPLTKDALGRSIIHFEELEIPNTIDEMHKFKKWFKANYTFKGKTGQNMTDEEFEIELERVMGKKTFEDVWVQFLPYDVGFWTAANLNFIYNYPMETITKPYTKDSQGMRVVTYSRLPLSRQINYTRGADMIPLPRNDSEIGSEFKTSKDTRWAVRAPLLTPFGTVNVYNLHTRAGESCAGVNEIMLKARSSYQADSLPYVLGGDFNAVLLKNDCARGFDNWPLFFNLAHLGLDFKLPPVHGGGLYKKPIPFERPIDYLAIPQKTASGSDFPISIDGTSGEILSAGIGHNDDFNPPHYPGVALSDHDGLVFDIVGSKIRSVSPLTSIHLPDYGLHEDDTDANIDPPSIGITQSTSDACFAEFKSDFEAMRSKSNVSGILLFSPFGDNPDPNFTKHRIHPSLIPELCGGGTCSGTKVGVNPGTIFGRAGTGTPGQFGFDWFLQISEQNNPGATISTINNLPGNTKAIIRIGVAESGIGFDSNPATYVAFLNTVWAGLSEGKKNTTYVIAGPNEPDIEWKWFAPECAPGHGSGSKADEATSQAFYNCIGPKLASYMNAIIAGNPGFKLLSPAFNMTSFTLQGIFGKMNSSGANWAGLAGIAGNIYPNQVTMTTHWTTNGVDSLLAAAGNLPLVITETGPVSCSLKEVNSPNDFYIQPIKGVRNPTDVNLIRTDLIKQGYEARCAAPGFKIALSNADLTAVQHYLKEENNPLGAVLGGIGIDGAPDTLDNGGKSTPVNNRVKSTLTIDYRDALVPIFRDFTRAPQLKQSLESYFGYTQTGASKYSDAEMKSAPVNSLLSQQERCTQSAISLFQRDIMCKKLQNPEACALYNTLVPNTSYTVKSLLEEYQRAVGISSDHFKNCAGIVSKESTLRDAMLVLPLTIEKAYRLAFLVTTIRTRIPTSASMMSLFQHPKRGILDVGPDPAHVVIINAFKVPDITTNKGTIQGQAESGDTPFNDPALLTRDLLIPSTMKQNLDTKGSEKREKLLQIADTQIAGKPQVDTNMEIMCEISGVGAPQCFDPVTRAVVDLINAQSLIDPDSLECGDYKAEEPQVIFDSADIHTLNNAGRVFNTDFGVALLENLFSDNTHAKPLKLEYDPTFADTNNKKSGEDQWDWGLKSVFYVINQTQHLPYGDGDARQVKHFIVYPEGYDLKTIEAVMSGSFFSSNQLQALQEKAKSFEYLKIAKDMITFEGGSTSLTYTDKSEPCGYEDEKDALGNVIGKKPKYCDRTIAFGLRADSDPRHAGILGGKLGYWLYTIQLAFNKGQSLAHKYLENCTKIEDFLLDQCGGTTVQQSAAQTPIYACTAFPSTTIDTAQPTAFRIEQEDGSTLTTADFLAQAGDKGCTTKIDTRVIDSVTLILSDGKKIFGNNPGNILSGCGSAADVSGSIVLYKWTGPGKPAVNDPRWDKMPRMRTDGQKTSRVLLNMKLKQGYYKLKTQLQNSICASSPKILSQFDQFTDDSGFILDFTAETCPSDACYTTTIQPAMQGGDESAEKADEINGCKLGFEYPIIKYNNACGGGRGGDCSDENGCQSWNDYIEAFKKDHAVGVTAYEKAFNKSLKTPSGVFTCTHSSYGRDPLFPSTSIKSDCSQFTNGSSPIDSIRIFGVDLSFTIPYWNAVDTQFTIPSEELWNAITDASKRHGCDPLLVLAVAHSESRTYTNHTVPNAVGALGVFQFTPGPWWIWKTANATGVSTCSIHQPPTFSTAGLDFTSPTNIPAAADSACRLILWTGMQKYQTDQRNFVRAFSSNGDNSYGQIWNAHQPQADYVWRLWNKLLEVTKQSPQPQPAGYPYGPCP